MRFSSGLLAPAVATAALASIPGPAFAATGDPGAATRPNVVILTVDDMNADSVGAFGCPLGGTTPHIDALAAQGMRFAHAQVNIAVCQPCRGVVMTGRYPHRSGIEGFQHLPAGSDIPTLMEILRDAGYRTGILGKVGHSTPKREFRWDLARDQPELGFGRDPSRYAAATAEHVAAARAEGRPFFLMANAHDPHRPFAGADQEPKAWKDARVTPPSRTFRPDEVPVPGFLPDLPEVRREIAEYFSSVRRADDTIGAVLAEIDKAGVADETVVIFFSDHGMALPFAKTNCYLHSTRTPLVVRWPGITAPGSVDARHVVSTVDFLPTILEVAGLDAPAGLDGRSMAPILRGGGQADRDFAFTQFHQTSARQRFPMRAVVGRDTLYVFNPWSDGERAFRNESQSGRTFKAMRTAARSDSGIAERVRLFEHRVPEEFFDLRADPDALDNLVDVPSFTQRVEEARKRLAAWMEATGDPALDALRHRGDEAVRKAFMEEQDERARRAANRNERRNPSRDAPR